MLRLGLELGLWLTLGLNYIVTLFNRSSPNPNPNTKNDSALGTIRSLVTTHKMTGDQIIDALNKQSVEIVLTAHPTEVNRRTMLRKHQRIKAVLEQQDRPDLLEYERRQLEHKLKAEVLSIWNSDALMRKKPTPLG